MNVVKLIIDITATTTTATIVTDTVKMILDADAEGLIAEDVISSGSKTVKVLTYNAE